MPYMYFVFSCQKDGQSPNTDLLVDTGSVVSIISDDVYHKTFIQAQTMHLMTDMNEPIPV